MQSPLARLLIAVLWLAAIATASKLLPIRSPVLAALVGCTLVVAGYVAYVKIIERRPLHEFRLAEAPRELGLGLALGSAMFATVMAIIWVCGFYAVTAVGGPERLIAPLVMAIVSAVPEEILFRGVIVRITEDGLGSVTALVISSLLFGAAHLGNPHATVLSGITIALEAGLLLGAAFIATRRLWLPIGLHAAWNFTQAGVFGVAVSGQTMDGLLISRVSGPTWMSGGAFGPEGSVPALIVCLLVGSALLRRAYLTGQVRRRQRGSRAG